MLNESKFSEPWVCCAFGNVFIKFCFQLGFFTMIWMLCRKTGSKHSFLFAIGALTFWTDPRRVAAAYSDDKCKDQIEQNKSAELGNKLGSVVPWARFLFRRFGSLNKRQKQEYIPILCLFFYLSLMVFLGTVANGSVWSLH